MGTPATPTKSSEKSSDSSAGKASTGPNALFFELEGVAVGVRQIACEVLTGLLAEDGVAFSPVLFSRYCLHLGSESSFARLADVLKLPRSKADKLSSDLSSGIAMFLASKQAELNPGFAKVVSGALEQRIPCAALSSLPLDVAESLMERTGLASQGVGLYTLPSSDAAFPRADSWLKLAKSLGKNPRNCAAFVSQRTSMRASLSAGMRCVVVPDGFTAFEDFGGADVVLDSYADYPVKELLDLAFPDFVRA